MSEDRIRALEENVAHLTGEVDSLSEQVRQLFARNEELTTALLRTRDRLTEVEDGGAGPHENTRPPHY